MHSPKLYTSHRHWVEGSKSDHSLTCDWRVSSSCKWKDSAHWWSFIRGKPGLAARSLCADGGGEEGKWRRANGKGGRPSVDLGNVGCQGERCK